MGAVSPWAFWVTRGNYESRVKEPDLEGCDADRRTSAVAVGGGGVVSAGGGATAERPSPQAAIDSTEGSTELTPPRILKPRAESNVYDCLEPARFHRRPVSQTYSSRVSFLENIVT